MQCQNCGQINTHVSNFCRFCGTKVAQSRYSGNQGYVPQMEPEQSYENSPPRPYSWKTDEFQINEPPVQKDNQLNHARPLASFQPPPNAALQPFQHQAAMSNNYRCPRCGSQLFPRIVRQISTGGWIVFAILLVAFFPLFWVGLLIKEEIRVCPVCNLKLD